jgi:hypothetical protein
LKSCAPAEYVLLWAAEAATQRRRWRRRRRHIDFGGSDSGGGGGGGGDSDEDNDGYYYDGGGGENGSDGLVCRRDHRTICQNNGFGLREHCVLFIICDIIDGIHFAATAASSIPQAN